MILHHFTSEIVLPLICVQGLHPGKSDFEGLGVWLTKDPDPIRQQWKLGCPGDKSAVRLTVEVPAARKELRRWRELAAEIGVSRRVYRALDASGGYGARHWWVYRGEIPPEWILRVEVGRRIVDVTKEMNAMKQRRREELRRLQRQFGRLPVDLVLLEDEFEEFANVNGFPETTTQLDGLLTGIVPPTPIAMQTATNGYTRTKMDGDK